MEEFVYKGYLCSEAQTFFGDKLISEQRDGCAVVGSFVKLADGNTRLASKGDKFVKHEDGSITVTSKY
jgi:hypothetical protein